MPLGDHFRPPVSNQASWEGFHGGWPMVMVLDLAPKLPTGFAAEPRVHLGSYFELNVCTFDKDGDRDRHSDPQPMANGGVATATRAPSAPTLTVDVEFPDQYAYEVLVFDQTRGRQLVAAVEIVSPTNKDRPESRQLFIAKCANLLRKDVCVSMVDLVTVRRFNLYTELLALLGQTDPSMSPEPPIYAATCRKRQGGRTTKLDTWAVPLVVGQALPPLYIWLTETVLVSLDLEATYEQTCRALQIG
ncbi:MAG TPA: DUF4058 family protein [Gemmataceae bacterium]|nr:DUF4058 family protein [Gemmataceae bacterium]